MSDTITVGSRVRFKPAYSAWAVRIGGDPDRKLGRMHGTVKEIHPHGSARVLFDGYEGSEMPLTTVALLSVELSDV